MQAIDTAFGYPKDGIQHHTFTQKHPTEDIWRVDVSISDISTRMFPLDMVALVNNATVENIGPGNSFWNPMIPA